jgi:FkbM family methyltransferase
LIADWVVKGYDYLFSVDSDIAFTPDTLVKLVAHNKDLVSGLYIQRKPGQHILEVYEHNATGGVSNIPYAKIKDRGLVEIAGCGFGCVLVKAEVMRSIGYPQFKYYSALDHRNTISEDVDFCRKALGKGFKIWADTSIQCRHIGSSEFLVESGPRPMVAPPSTVPSVPSVKLKPEEQPINDRLRDLGSQRLLPHSHVTYLTQLKQSGVEPKVIYDIGSCVLHWTNEASKIWTGAEFVAFEAMASAEFLYKERGLKYHIGVLSDVSGKEVDFYQNDVHPGGNSYYKENEEVNPDTVNYFNDTHLRKLRTVTLDAVARLKKFPAPDLIKMDVQGAELDVLKGASEVLASVQHVILELQAVEYNKGAPLKDTVIEYMNSIGFDCKGIFSNNGPDGDYHFVKR